VQTTNALPSPIPLDRLRQFFAERGATAYLVGGFLRDLLAGRPTLDLDLAVDGDALALARALADAVGGSFVVLDAARDVGRVVLPLRSDAPASQHPRRGQAFVDIARLRGGGIDQDLALRDFTVNALAVDLAQAVGDPPAWPLRDPFRGRADLEARLLRVVSATAFQDDPIRPLRAVRFVAQLGLRLEPSTERLLRRHGRLVTRASPERCREELLKTLAQPRAAQNLRLMDTVGILTALFPELESGRGVEQPREHYWDVFTHHLEAAARMEEILSADQRAQLPALRSVPWQPWLDEHFRQELGDGHTRATLLKLTALLHDVGKPQTKTIAPDLRIRFFGHAEQGAELAAAALRRLRCSDHVVRYAQTIIANHLRPNQMAQRGQWPTKRALYRFYRDVGDAGVDTVYHCMADYLAARGPWLTQGEWEQQCALMAHILPSDAQKATPSVPKLVDGNDLQELFGMAPGPGFRTLLEAVREAQAIGEVTSREEALALLRTLVADRQGAAGQAS
jgi:putative nucleotidyltransferase with HDIG domain